MSFRIKDYLPQNPETIFRIKCDSSNVFKGEDMMFTYKVDEQIVIELLHQHHKEELYKLIDTNREHLRKWLLWVGR
jgi:hypothetical protein